MQLRFMLAFMALSGMNPLFAQKVIRKGMPPIQQKNYAPPAPYTLGQINGKWQEVKRTGRTNTSAMSFTDSLQIAIRGVNAEIRDGGAMSMYLKGQAQIEAPNVLQVAGDSYTILALSKNQMILDDGEYVHTMNRVNQFYYETLGKLEVKPESFGNPVIVTPAKLVGKWEVYRRQAAPGAINDQTILIRSINIKSDSADHYATGEISFYQKDITTSSPMTIHFVGGEMQIHAGDRHWTFYTYKADGKEFVFGKEGELLYYAKAL